MRFDPSLRRTFPWSRSFLAALLVLTALLVATAARAEAKLFRLDNGMELIVVEDHRAPSVVHMLWYDVGSIDEPAGKTGVAHVFEHMMFKGTPTVGPGEFSRRVAELGGRDNAFTSRDYTAYFEQIPPQALEEVMKLEADRMQHLAFDPNEFAKEREVVREERRPVPLFPLFLHPRGKLFPLVARRNLHPQVRDFLLEGHRLHGMPPFGEILRVMGEMRLLPAIFFLKSRADCDVALKSCRKADMAREDMGEFHRQLAEMLTIFPSLRNTASFITWSIAESPPIMEASFPPGSFSWRP